MGASTASLLITILSIVIALSSSSASRSSEACGRAVYWGQSPDEGSLRAVCDTGYYDYINLAYLNVSDRHKPPVLNLDAHCDPDSCKFLSNDIRYCQDQGIKVLLSLQIFPHPHGNYVNSDVGDGLADYIEINFFEGDKLGPLGDVSLDGVDFHVESPDEASSYYWYRVAQVLSEYSDKIHLAASPKCNHSDETLKDAINDEFFDYVWVQFYNNTDCDYSGSNAQKVLLDSWKKWSSSLPKSSQLFMGLPETPDAAQSGWIPRRKLVKDILPEIKKTSNYGGLMLWNMDAPYVKAAAGAACVLKARINLDHHGSIEELQNKCE